MIPLAAQAIQAMIMSDPWAFSRTLSALPTAPTADSDTAEPDASFVGP